TGTEGSTSPFWSPDSRYVAFFQGMKLYEVEVPDGTPQAVCDAPAGRGGTWSNQGTILFGTLGGEGIRKVSATGGTWVSLPRPSDIGLIGGDVNPSFLPDGRHYLFARSGVSDSASGIYVGSLDADQVVRILSDRSSAVYAPPGELLYVHDGNLVAQP